MTMTKNNTIAALDEELAAAKAHANRLAERKAAIDQAEADARRTTEIEYYTDAAGTRAHDKRDRRDAAKAKLDKLAGADAIHLNELFDAFIEFKRRDAECGALHDHASRINYVAPLGRNSLGVDQAHVIACSQLHERLTWSQYLDQVVAERTQRARSQHAAELQDEVYAKISAAAEQARTAAASGDA
jgi:hypothetical protein